MKILALGLVLMTLAGCTGVLDNCQKGLEDPPGGYRAPHHPG